MEFFIFLTLGALIAYILFKPISKKELEKYDDKDNWSNMGF
tara:strand:- start:384 stop:506 length:123 start_codon:yes stop_codon:yes gene_type:complete